MRACGGCGQLVEDGETAVRNIGDGRVHFCGAFIEKAPNLEARLDEIARETQMRWNVAETSAEEFAIIRRALDAAREAR